MNTTDRPLTDRQQQILAWIAAYVRVHGFGPTVREVAAAMGSVSPNGAMSLIRPLRRKGYLRPHNGKKARQLLPVPRPAGEIRVERNADGVRLTIGELVAALLSESEAAQLAQQILNVL